MKIYEMMAYLRDEPSPKKSLEFILANKTEELIEVLQFLGNPYIKTGLSFIKNWNGSFTGMGCSSKYATEQLIDFFTNCGPNGERANKEKYALKYFYAAEEGNNDPNWKWFVELIATHGNSSKFGVGWSTLNKAGIEVPGFGCQLGVDTKNTGFEILEGKRWRISEKIDGTRRLFIKKNGECLAYSRSGREDVKLSHITNWFMSNDIPDNRIYDCELVDRDMWDNRKNDDLESFEMRAKSIGKAARKTGDKTDLIAICFDYYDFDNPDSPLGERGKSLYKIFKNEKLVDPVRKVPIFETIYGYDKSTIDRILDVVYGYGGEGLMLQNINSKYEFRRTDNLLKIKKLEEFKAKIIEVIPGRKGTRLEGSTKAIRCRVKGCTLEVNVGTGLSDEDRRIFWENKEELLGAKVELEAFSKTVNKQGQSSLCFPVFKRCLHKLFGEVE